VRQLIPDSLLGLPTPWDQLDLVPDQDVDDPQAARATAVEAIERLLDGISAIRHVQLEGLPEYVTVAASLWAKSFISYMPRFQDLRLEPIADAFRRQDPTVTDEVVRKYAVNLIRERANRLVGAVKEWLFKALRSDPDEEVFEALCRLVERQWRVHPEFAWSQLFYLSLLDRDKALELAQHILGSPDIQPELAASLKELIDARSTS